MTWRIRSVRKRILLLALVPLLSLFGLYVFTTSITARNAINLARADTLKNATGQPTGTFEGEIQAERLLAVLYLAAPTPENQAKLIAVEQAAGHQAAALRSTLMSGATMNNASAPQKQAIDTLLAGIKGLPALQAQVAARTISLPPRSPPTTPSSTTATRSSTRPSARRPTPRSSPRRWRSCGSAGSGDLLGQENAILLGDLSTGSFPAADRRQFTQLAGARRYLVQLTLPDLDPAYRAYYTRDVSPLASASLTPLENKVMAARPRHLPAVSPLALGADGRRGHRRVLQGGHAVGERAHPAGQQRRLVHEPPADRDRRHRPAPGDLLHRRGHPHRAQPGAGAARPAAVRARPWRTNGCPRWWTGSRWARTSMSPPRPRDIPASSDEIGQVRDAFATVQQTAVRGRRRAGPAAAGHQRGLPQPGPAQPVAAAPPARAAGRDGAPGARPAGARGPVPHRPPDHPHAPARREPDHPVRRLARARLAQPGAAGGRAARRRGRGGGLHPDPGHAGDPGLARRPGGRRRHPHDRRACRERDHVLPAATPRW